MLPTHDGLSDEEYEANLRTYLLHNLVRPEELKFAKEWLRKYEASLTAASSAKRDAREEAILSAAKEANTIALSAAVSASDANDIAQSAKRYAFVAAMTAIVAAIAAIKWR
jgi:hypothetical protein